MTNEEKYLEDHLKRFELINKPLPSFNIIKTQYARCNNGPSILIGPSEYKSIGGFTQGN
jgi:hypothetical protein